MIRDDCNCIAQGIDGTGRHGAFSNLVFSNGPLPSEDFDISYVYPCTNHWKAYYENKWVFECVVVGKDRLKIMPGTWIDRWEVKGSKGDIWVVAKKLDGSFGCSCPGWKFKKAPKPDCKHISAIVTAMNAGIMPQSKLKANVTENRERIVERRMGFGDGYRIIEVKDLTQLDEDVKVGEEFFHVKRKFRLED